jgi:hypothetical protein
VPLGQHFYIDGTILGQGRGFEAHLHPFALAFYEDFTFPVSGKISNYLRPECHVVLKAFSISKNTATVDVLLLKFKVT